ncbi:MAG: MerR family transcriptional regulator [Lachnospiraceae bacterium]|nr:MerR family transcriptional regulator [Lachnospiraceae bacterium]
MEKYRAIQQGYMTAGEVARKMDITVRTLQYYHREGLLSPSAFSQGGRRLYTDKDIVKLHQILSLKHLGFSLDDIKNRLIPLDDPLEVADILEEQAGMLREKIEGLSKALAELETLRGEVLKMQSVDFKKYADIIVNLQMKNDFYWMLKHFDSETLDHIRSRFDRDSGIAFLQRFIRLQEEAISLGSEGVLPKSERGQEFARNYWNMITEFTGGNLSLLPKLMEIRQNEEFNQEWGPNQAQADAFIEPALEAYFSRLGMDPFQEKSSEKDR